MTEEKSSKDIIERIEEWDRRVFLFFYDKGFFKNKKIIMFAKIYSFKNILILEEDD